MKTKTLSRGCIASFFVGSVLIACITSGLTGCSCSQKTQQRGNAPEPAVESEPKAKVVTTTQRAWATDDSTADFQRPENLEKNEETNPTSGTDEHPTAQGQEHTVTGVSPESPTTPPIPISQHTDSRNGTTTRSAEYASTGLSHGKSEIKDANRKAHTALKEAQAAASRGRDKDAFENALKGWKAVSEFTEADPESQRLGQSLLTEMERAGEALNRHAAHDPTDDRKTIEFR